MSVKGDALSAAADLQVALVARCAADAALGALLGVGDAQRLYASTAPKGTPLPYVTLGLTTEAENGASTFDKWGAIGGVRPDIWTDRATYGNLQGLVIYGHFKRLFHGRGKQLVLPSHDIVTCVVELVLDIPDVNGQAQHTQILITARSAQHA